MSAPRIRILFLCTGNSARSIMAEAIANQRFADRIRAFSAGSHPKPEPNPLTLATLARHGLDTSGLRSKDWSAFRDMSFDLVVTLCDAAAGETCPAFPGAPIRVHWGFPDPPAAADQEAAFEQVFQGLCAALDRFVRDDTEDLASRADAVARMRNFL